MQIIYLKKPNLMLREKLIDIIINNTILHIKYNYQ
jgi:hypothetical protein